MDLNDFLPTTDEVVVELKHPKTKEPIGMSVTLYATHTKEFKEAQYKLIDTALAKRAKVKEDYIPSAKETDENRILQLAEITKSWDIKQDGKPVKLSVEKAVEIYNKLPFVRSQLETALEEFEDFI